MLLVLLLSLSVLPTARSSHASGETEGRGSGAQDGLIVILLVYPLAPSTEVGASQEGDRATTRHGKVCVAMLDNTGDGEEDVKAEETVEEDEEGEVGGDVCEEDVAIGLLTPALFSWFAVMWWTKVGHARSLTSHPGHTWNGRLSRVACWCTRRYVSGNMDGYTLHR